VFGLLAYSVQRSAVGLERSEADCPFQDRNAPGTLNTPDANHKTDIRNLPGRYCEIPGFLLNARFLEAAVL
jgi:hypothetical protein